MSLALLFNIKASDIKLVSIYSIIKMMHGPINISLRAVNNEYIQNSLRAWRSLLNTSTCVLEPNRFLRSGARIRAT